MELINKSSISSKKIIKLLEFCRPKNGKLPKIIFKNCKKKNQLFDCAFHFPLSDPGHDPFIIIRFNNEIKYPAEFNMSEKMSKKFGYVQGKRKFANKWESLIFCMSHELRHAAHWDNRVTRQWYYHNLKKIEKLADKFADRKLKKYRELVVTEADPLK